ncbi:MAG: hypothetical protein PWP44_1146 [Thermacetogenium sp.]|nr:hypothetical protein [Thermacetogenium sp.]
MGFLIALLACAGTLSAALAVYYRQVGNHNILFETPKARDVEVKHDIPAREIRCRCLIPLTNRGKQQGMVNNVFCQPVYCGKIMKELEILPRIRLLREKLRENGYWESMLLKSSDSMLTELEVVIRSRLELPLVVREVPRLTILIYYQVVGRKGIDWRLAEISFDLAAGRSAGGNIRKGG